MAAKGDYPLPKFHFQVEWGSEEFRMGFTEALVLTSKPK